MCAADVRFGSKADIGVSPRNVCFTPKSGHWNSLAGCLLCAKSGHSRRFHPFEITVICARGTSLVDDSVDLVVLIVRCCLYEQAAVRESNLGHQRLVAFF
jgi:hypothetical protein